MNQEPSAHIGATAESAGSLWVASLVGLIGVIVLLQKDDVDKDELAARMHMEKALRDASFSKASMHSARLSQMAKLMRT